ncbi:MAG: hypothetical protein JSS82_12640 [Bacteroidetes bacterium]|nr:hypothetical protein [Bacteroidota bacterium]
MKILNEMVNISNMMRQTHELEKELKDSRCIGKRKREDIYDDDAPGKRIQVGDAYYALRSKNLYLGNHEMSSRMVECATKLGSDGKYIKPQFLWDVLNPCDELTRVMALAGCGFSLSEVLSVVLCTTVPVAEDSCGLYEEDDLL